MTKYFWMEFRKEILKKSKQIKSNQKNKDCN